MAMRDMIKNSSERKIFSELKKKLKISKNEVVNLSNKLIKNNFGGSTDGSKIVFSNQKAKLDKSFLRTIEYFNLERNKLQELCDFMTG